MVRVGLLGVGFMGATHAEALAQVPDAHLAAVVASRPERAASLAAHYQAKVHPSIEALLADPDIDAVDICLPTPLHEPVMIAAAQAGKHILCEKPIALTLAAVDRMEESVRTAGVMAMIGQVIRFWPQYMATRSLLEDKQIERPHHVHAYRLVGAPSDTGWFSDPAQSGGALIDLQIHDLDYLYALFGMPIRVYASGTRLPSGAWNHVGTTLSFANTTATVEASAMMPGNYPFRAGFRMVGAQTCIEYDFRVAGQVDQRASAQHEFMLYRSGHTPEALTAPEQDAYLAQISYFITCVQTGRRPTTATLAEARAVLSIALAAKESLETGQAVALA